MPHPQPKRYRKNKRFGIDTWHPEGGSRPSISVIERGDPADDRPGVPFGFSRALADPPRVKSGGWDEYAEVVGGVRVA